MTTAARVPSREIIEMVAIRLVEVRDPQWVRDFVARAIGRVGEGGAIIDYLHAFGEQAAFEGDEPVLVALILVSHDIDRRWAELNP
jgi:hypothetical protein